MESDSEEELFTEKELEDLEAFPYLLKQSQQHIQNTNLTNEGTKSENKIQPQTKKNTSKKIKKGKKAKATSAHTLPWTFQECVALHKALRISTSKDSDLRTEITLDPGLLRILLPLRSAEEVNIFKQSSAFQSFLQDYATEKAAVKAKGSEVHVCETKKVDQERRGRNQNRRPKYVCLAQCGKCEKNFCSFCADVPETEQTGWMCKECAAKCEQELKKEEEKKQREKAQKHADMLQKALNLACKRRKTQGNLPKKETFAAGVEKSKARLDAVLGLTRDLETSPPPVLFDGDPMKRDYASQEFCVSSDSITTAQTLAGPRDKGALERKRKKLDEVLGVVTKGEDEVARLKRVRALDMLLSAQPNS
eukprot:Colp12_sorted_trinity150504_noHs@6342